MYAFCVRGGQMSLCRRLSSYAPLVTLVHCVHIQHQPVDWRVPYGVLEEESLYGGRPDCLKARQK